MNILKEIARLIICEVFPQQFDCILIAHLGLWFYQFEFYETNLKSNNPSVNHISSLPIKDKTLTH